MVIKWKKKKPKGRTQSDKRPNQERKGDGGGESVSENKTRVVDQPGGSTVWKSCGSLLCLNFFYPAPRPPSIPGDSAHPISHPHPPAAI